jgi:hypothetical protein
MSRPRIISFKTVLQRGNRVQVPKFVRLQFKIEANQVLKVGIQGIEFGRGWQYFYARIGKDGRISIPKLTQALLLAEKPRLAGAVFSVTLETT